MIHILFDRPDGEVTPTYKFHGAQKAVAWPMRDGANLGAGGAWNMFLRLGFAPAETSNSGTTVPPGGILVVTPSVSASQETRDAIRRWHAAGNWVIGAGDPAAFGELLPVNSHWMRSPYPANALAYGTEGGAEIVAPSAWSFAQWPSPPSGALGAMVSIGGERQSPGRALILPFENAPAMVAGDRFLYLNGNPFAALQSWLQGQHDLSPWLGWRSRLFWLDEQVAMLWRQMSAHVPPLSAANRPGVSGLGPTTVVLRHDLDSSRDTTYLDMEVEHQVAGNWAVLLDRNRDFWVKRLAGLKNVENCFHYNTISRPAAILTELRRRITRTLGGQPSMAAEYRPATREIVGRGLSRQLARARAGGIGIETIHRHGPFLLYPEWIDALDYCFASIPDFAGASSLFRGAVLRWGVREVDGHLGTADAFPDSAYPLWWPFKLAHAGRGGALLRGWESTSLMESEPAMVARLLDHRIPELPQRVFTLGYHPQHALNPSFRPGGSAVWLKEILEILRSYGCAAMNLRDVYRAMDAT